MLRFRNNKLVLTLLLVLLSITALTGCGQNNDPTTTPVVTLNSEQTNTTPAISTAAPVTTVDATTAGESTTAHAHALSNPVFEGVLGGIIGSRPANGSVYDLEKTYFKNTEIFASAGHNIYEDVKFPQLKSKSEGAKAFNSYIKIRARDEAETAFVPIISAIEYGSAVEDLRWLYYDYGVIESDRYISIILATNNSSPTNPLNRFEIYVFDKKLERMVIMGDIADSFGIDRDALVSKLENLFPENNVELMQYENFFYEYYYRKYLSYVWNSMYDERDGRGPEEAFMRHESVENSALVGLYVDEKNELHVVYSKTVLSGMNEETGNLLFEMTLVDALYSELPETPRAVNPIFEYYAAKGAPVNELTNAMVIRLPNLNTDECAELVTGFFAEIPSRENISIARTHSQDDYTLFIIIPRYSASISSIQMISQYADSVMKIGNAQIISTDVHENDGYGVFSESRDRWYVIGIGNDEGAEYTLDITGYVNSEYNDEFTQTLTYMKNVFN